MKHHDKEKTTFALTIGYYEPDPIEGWNEDKSRFSEFTLQLSSPWTEWEDKNITREQLKHRVNIMIDLLLDKLSE